MAVHMYFKAKWQALLQADDDLDGAKEVGKRKHRSQHLIGGFPMNFSWCLVFHFIVSSCSSLTYVDGFSLSRKNSNNKYNDDNNVKMLSKVLRIIYNQNGTLGVLQRSKGMSDYDATTLVAAAMEASNGDKGMASGILNASIGSCCSCDDDNDDASRKRESARKAIDLLKAYDKLDTIEPDLVALSLAYVATSHGGLEDKAEKFLCRAQQLYNVGDDDDDGKFKFKKNEPVDYSELEKLHNIQVLDDAEEFIALSKPSGMVCYHPSTTTPKQRQKDRSLEDILLENGVQLSTLNQEGRGFVHRIDRGTSGCMILAKTNRMHAILMSQFFLRNVKKSYQALVVSPDPKTKKLPKKGIIEVEIDGRPAKSYYNVEKQVGPFITRIKVNTEQGRRHQVRIHCSQGLHAPILLDPLYGGGRQTIISKLKNLPQERLDELLSAKRFCLHADTLSIADYGINIQAPLPEWWKQLEEELMQQ